MRYVVRVETIAPRPTACEGLYEANVALRDGCADQGVALAGSMWEIYGHYDDDPAKRRTDIYYLLEEPVKDT